MRIAAMMALSLGLAHGGVRPMPSPPAKAQSDDKADASPSAPVETQAPARGTQPIPFQTTPFFADNRVGSEDVKLPPLPSSLYPVPPPERHPLPVVLPRPGLIDYQPTPHAAKPRSSNASANSASNPGNAGPAAILGTADTADQNIATSPFINWIAKTPNAADIARQTQEGYSVNGVAENAIGSTDLFYNIRFPYAGSEQAPPGGSAVIYTTPKK